MGDPRGLVETMKEGYILQAAGYKITFYNHTGCRIQGYILQAIQDYKEYKVTSYKLQDTRL